MSNLLTTPEACEYLRIGRSTLYRLAALRRIRRVRIAGATRWKRSDLDRYIDAQTQRPARA